MTVDADWQQIFFDPQSDLSGKLASLAARRFGTSPDADAAYNHALDTLSADNWQRLRTGYKGRGSPQGFLRVSFIRLLEDYAVGKYGKRRPPVWIKRLGTTWTRVYEMLCLKRLPTETIVDNLCARGAIDADKVRFAISQIRARVSGCGQYSGEYTADNPETTVADNISQTSTGEIEQEQLATLLRVLSSLVEGNNGPAAADRFTPARASRLAGDVIANVVEIRKALRITDTERLLLKLIYQDGFSVARAAKALKLHEQKVRRNHKAIINRIGQIFRRFGIDADSIPRVPH